MTEINNDIKKIVKEEEMHSDVTFFRKYIVLKINVFKKKRRLILIKNVCTVYITRSCFQTPTHQYNTFSRESSAIFSSLHITVS